MTEAGATWRSADAVVVEASIRGRVLGLRLLRLDAAIVIRPAAAAAPGPPASAPALASRHGDALADAVRLLGEGSATLDAARALTTPSSRRPRAGRGR
ncbi:MAG: hypothetical protein IRZ32_08560 [Solirubrobacteraceae bacterium]|nr:hypothetical protein [Solirubrobacteraceae bacterium]